MIRVGGRAENSGGNAAQGPRFEYAPAKSAANKHKHGIDFDEAQALWEDPRRQSGPGRYDDEQRYSLIGEAQGKVWTAIWTPREGVIRLISVRRARANGVAIYGSVD